MEINYYRALTNAVRYLKFIKKISSNGDIVDATGVNKGALSMYLNGKEAPSKNFITNFQRAYKLNLADYDRDEEDIKKPATDAGVRDREIELLMQLIQEKERNIKTCSEMFEMRLKGIESRQLVVLEQILQLRAKLTNEDFAELAVKANNFLVEKIGEK